MTTNERLLIGALFSILMGLTAWLLGTVNALSTVTAVLQHRADNHVIEMKEMKQEMKDHRANTERRETR